MRGAKKDRATNSLIHWLLADRPVVPPAPAPIGTPLAVSKSMDRQRNINASLNTEVKPQGTDRLERRFEVHGESIDFGRMGIGNVLDQDILEPGAAVAISVPNEPCSTAAVPWSRNDLKGGKFRAGLQLLGPRISLSFRILACCLLAMATIGQFAAAKSRANRVPNTRCEIGLAEMKNMVDRTLGGLGFASETEKAFLHLQHQRMSCEEYTRLFEKSDFYRDEKKRKAVSAWHWSIYHAGDHTLRDRAIRDLEPILATVH
jgi:hypothetical protein